MKVVTDAPIEHVRHCKWTAWQDALPRQVEWLLEATREREWQEVLPRGAEYLRFDYEAEDALVRSLAA